MLVSGYYGPGLGPHGYRAKWPIVAETGMETHREQGSRSRLLCQASLSGPVLRSLLSSHAIARLVIKNFHLPFEHMYEALNVIKKQN